MRKEDVLSRYFAEIGHSGGKARLEKIDPEKRRKIAIKASKAPSKTRTVEAQARKKAEAEARK